VPFTFLRNWFCTGNHTAQIPSYLAHGATVGAAGRRVHLGCLTSRLRGRLRHRTDPGQPPERGIRAGRSAIHHARPRRGGRESYREPP
jgi:hypothetical protein